MLQAQFLKVINESTAKLKADIEENGVEDDVDLGVALNAVVNLNNIVHEINKSNREKLKEEAQK